MKTIFKAIISISFGFTMLASAQAAVINVSMTADNVLSGGVCSDSTCTTIDSNWSDFGAMTNSGNWQLSDSVSLNLSPGTYTFAWLVENSGANSSGNPAALLAEYTIDGNTVSSSSDWEIFNSTTGDFISNATEYGANGQSGVIWTNAVGGAIAGVSTNANWIYSANNFANADRSVWIRTTVEVTSNNVSAPSMLALLALGVLFVANRRKA